jgi:hypothetical protein
MRPPSITLYIRILATFHLHRVWKGHIKLTSCVIFASNMMHLLFKFGIIRCKATSWCHILWLCLIFLLNTCLCSNRHWIFPHFIHSTLRSSKYNICIRKNILHIIMLIGFMVCRFLISRLILWTLNLSSKVTLSSHHLSTWLHYSSVFGLKLLFVELSWSWCSTGL